MLFNIENLAFINLSVQFILILLLNYATFLAKKKDLRKHCTIIRIAAVIQISAIIAIMLEPMLIYLENDAHDALFNLELLIHHSLGILSIILWIYINIVFARIIRSRDYFKIAMKFAYIVWTLAFILGMHIYSKIYL